MKLTLKQKLITSFILVSALTLTLSSLLFYRTWLDYAVKSKTAELNRQAEVLADSLTVSRNNQVALQAINRIIKYSSVITGARVIVFNAAGQVTTDTGRPVLGTEPVLQNRPAPQIPRRLNQLDDVPKLDSKVAFAAKPLENGGRLLLVSQVRDIKRAQGPALNILLVTSIISFFIASLAGSYLAFSLTKPLDKLKMAVRNMSRGQFLQRVPIETSDELGGLVQAFNFMSARVDKAYNLQQDFASNVSHELKTPLTSIEGFSKVLLDGQVADQEQQRKYLSIINTESRRIEKIVNDLLALARIDTGAFKPQISKVNAKEMLLNISEKFTPLARNKNISFDVAASADLEFIGDSAVAEQIIGNLVENAIKYTENGGRVEVSARPDGPDICFIVKDNGIGIPLDKQHKIFERFYRAENSSSKTGAGLGLSICLALAKSLGGEIKVDSTPGKGTDFSVFLPKTPRLI